MQNTKGYLELFIRMNLQAGAPMCSENGTQESEQISSYGTEFGSIIGDNVTSQLVDGKFTYFQACSTGVCIPTELCKSAEG